MQDREVDRPSDEALRVCGAVKLLGLLDHRRLRDQYRRIQRHFDELAAAIGFLDHAADRLIAVVENDDPSGSCQTEVPEHVALGEGGNEQFLGVPSLRVTAERGIGAAEKFRLSDRGYCMIARISLRAGRSGSQIARPLKVECVGM